MLKFLLVNTSDFRTNKKIGNKKNIILLLLICLNILFTNQSKIENGCKFMDFHIWAKFKELKIFNEFPTELKKKAEK